MSQTIAEKRNSLKNKASGMFSSRAGVAAQSNVKGLADTIQILSLAAKAGISAASVPLATAARAGNDTFSAGALAACDEFRRAAKKAGRKVMAEKGMTTSGTRNYKKGITPSGGDGAFADDAYAVALYRLIQTTPAIQAKQGATHTFTIHTL